jgi:hypothetical protein
MGRSAAFLRMLREAGIITALKCAWTLAHREEKRSGARMTPVRIGKRKREK